jgi:hypothetical protein
MIKTAIATLLMATFSQNSGAQTVVARDPVIEQMVKEISPDSLGSHVQNISYGTRSTVSTQTDKKRGIGAARNWVLSKFS